MRFEDARYDGATVKALKKSASGPSYPDAAKALEQLSAFVATDIPIHHFELFYPVILDRLSPNKNIPLGPKSETPGPRVRLAHLSLFVLSRAFRRRQGNFEDSMWCFSHKNWQTIWVWVEFLFDTWIQNKIHTQDGLEFRKNVWGTLATLVARLAIVFHLETHLPERPPVVSMMTRLWIVAAKTDDAVNFDCTTGMLRAVLCRPDDSLEGHFSDTIRTLITPDDLVSILFKKLRESRHAALSRGSLRDMAFVVLHCSDHVDGFFQLMLAKGGAREIAYVMYRLTSRHQSVDLKDVDSDLQAGVMGLSFCGSFIYDCLIHSHHWVAQALEGRLIPAMFRSQRFMEHQLKNHPDDLEESPVCPEHLFPQLLDTMTPYLLWPLVLQQAVKSMKTVEAKGLEPAMAQRPAFQEAWKSFVAHAKHRKIHKSGPYKLHRTNMCNNQKCPHPRDVDNSPDLPRMYCSRCRFVVYCSRTCQRDDWRDAHRARCDVVVANRLAGSSMRPNVIEFDFLRESVYSDILQNKADVRALLAHYLSQYPSETDPLVVEYHFGKYPPTQSVAPERAYSLDHRTSTPQWAELVEEARARRLSLVCATIPIGYESAKWDQLSPVRFLRLFDGGLVWYVPFVL